MIVSLVPTAPPVEQQSGVQPTLDPSGPSLTQITLTEQVGSDDCPVNPTTSFSSRATDIYVTAVANNVGQSDTLTANFSLNGQSMKTYSWSPGFDDSRGVHLVSHAIVGVNSRRETGRSR